jgi:hypothetical protein
MDILMSWDQNIAHLVRAKPSGSQYNSPVTLGLKIGTLSPGQEKSTVIEWIDANPFCENVGTDGDEDICFYNAVTSSSYTNYSDATSTNSRYPHFKITHANIMPVGCTWTCKMYRQDTSGGSWTIVDTGTGASCYNVYPASAFNCYVGTNGYCKMLHTKTIDNRTQWDLCITYSGRLCSEAGNVYCGLGHLGGGSSHKGDYRINMSYNQNTPFNVNSTLLNSTDWINASFDVILGIDGDNILINKTKWYFNQTYNATYDDNVSINLTEACYENMTFQIQTWDDSYFSPTDNQTWIWSNLSYSCVEAEEEDDSYIFAIIASFVLTGLILIYYAAKLDEEHKPLKLLFVSTALLIFLAGFHVADLLIELDLSGYYIAFLWIVITTIFIKVIFFLKDVFTKLLIRRDNTKDNR